MWLGCLWLSILNATASPSPMSMTPAFSPGPWITHGASVGSVRRWIFDDLYEQCSFHMAEKMPSSVKLGARPINCRVRSYSSGLRPWTATSAGLMRGSRALLLRTPAGVALIDFFFLAAAFATLPRAALRRLLPVIA